MDEITCSGPCACQPPADDRGTVSRRLVLAGAAGAAMGMVALAGCASPDDTATPGDPTTPGATTPAQTSPAETSPAETTAPTEDETPAAAALAGTDDFPVGGGAVVSAGSGTYILTHPSDAEFAAFVGVCPHAQCKRFEVLENTIECQCHFSTFDAGTGERLGGPAPRGLEAVAVRVEDGQIFLA